MKGSYIFGSLALLLATGITTCAQAQTGGYSVVKRGPDYKVLQKTVVENGTNRTVRYTELATGMNYTNSQGQLTEAQEQITLLPTGGAAATQGRHQVYFPADIYNGVLEVVTPDGRHLKSRPLGVSYDDGSNTVFIATLKDSVGFLTSSNQVTYRDAFTGFKGDLVMTFRRGGFECDLVFRQQPPTPDQFGLDSSFTTLELVTEFFNTQDPQQIPATSDEWFGLQDSTLKFGKLTMTHGKAFAVKTTNSPATMASSPVYKSWLHSDGRTFLVESVPLINIAEDLDALPLTASIINPKSKIKHLASSRSVFPPAHGLVTDTNQILIASIDLDKNPGVVLDYNEIDSSQDTFTFYDGMTYYVSGPVESSPTTIFEGGSIIKGPEIDFDFCTNVICTTDHDNPTIFTSPNDDTVGDIIDGSSGTPAPWEGTYLSGVPEGCILKNLRFYYTSCGIESWAATCEVWDCQFFNFGFCAILKDGSGGNWLGMHNVLIAQRTLNYDYDGAVEIYGDTVVAENVTVDQVPCFIYDENSGSRLFLTNCLLTGSGMLNNSDSIVATQNVEVLPNPTIPIYQTAANAQYYLAGGSPYRNAGTTNIDPVLLAEIQTMTTYAPQDGGAPDNDGQPDLGYHYPINEDSDHDGLPDWWEYYWFGNYTHSGGDLDASGNTLLADYQTFANGDTSVDPNIITFTIEATNDYVNTTSANLQLNITAGTPSYYAIFVNSSTTTNWLPFTTTNLIVSLGGADGIYDVVVGLKGWPDGATQTWQDYTFTLDRVAPVISITNPVITSAAGIGSATVIKPFLQLQGFADKQLFSLSYDISNATSLMTNQNAFVTGQHFDAIKNDFTTNFFQAYDVPLTNGLNNVTLRVTDRAGNTTTTNFSTTLDYSLATTAPVVTLIWPQDGQAVSGTSITIRGTMSDETGTVVAQVVNGDGTTSTINGLVERNHMFWLENVPLNGTSHISIQATDASGKNITTSNFTLLSSSLILTIDGTPTGDNLYQPAGQVSGTVGDASATVTVNGMAATVDAEGNGAGAYNWSADNVPIYGPGTAVFDAKAATANDATTANAAVEMSPMVQIVSYNDSETDKIYQRDDLLTSWVWTKSYQATYRQGQETPMTFTKTAYEYLLDDKWYQHEYWYHWSETDPGTMTEEDWTGEVYPDLPINSDENFRNGSISGVPDSDDAGSVVYGTMGSSNYRANHYFAENVPTYTFFKYGTKYEELQIAGAHTAVTLYTGGKAGVNRMNLFCINAWAQEYQAPKHGYWDMAWVGTSYTDVDKTKLTVMGKNPGADGNVWIPLPDNGAPDITVHAPAKHYNAGAGAGKYKLHILANGYPLADDRVRLQAHYVVGEYIGFDQAFSPPLPETPQYNPIQWALGGTFVNDSRAPAYSDGSTIYQMTPSKMTAPTTYAWWYDGEYNPSTLTATLGEGLTFANGQYVAIATHGQFTMHRPRVTKAYESPDISEDIEHNHFPQIPVHNDRLVTCGCTNALEIDSITPFSGEAFITQTINGSVGNTTGLGILLDTCGSYYLDNSVPYGAIIPVVPNVSSNILPFQDGPDIACSGYTWTQLGFTDYITFAPDVGPGPNIPVTLAIEKWHNNATTSLLTNPATNIQDYSPFEPVGSTPPDAEPTGNAKWDSFGNDNLFPYWSHTATNHHNNTCH